MRTPGKRPIRRKRTYDLWANAMAKKWGISRAEFNSHPYDYASYYNDNPDLAWEHIDNKLAPYQHFPDDYKTVDHPTFSKQSTHSGKISIRNPKGIVGGEWNDAGDAYTLSPDQVRAGWDIDNTAKHLTGEGVTVYSPHGKTLIKPRFNSYARGKDDPFKTGELWNINGSPYYELNNLMYDSSGSRVQFGAGTEENPTPVAGGPAVVTPSRRQRLGHPLIWKDIANNLYVNTPEEKAIRNTTPTTEALSAITGGMVDLNRLDASLNLRLGYDLLTGNFANASKGFVYGNNGLVSDKFAEEHPYLSTAINYSADALGGLLTAAALSPKKTARLVHNAGQAVADVVSGPQTRNVVENIKNKIAWASAIPQRIRDVFPLKVEAVDGPMLPSISNDKIFIDDAGELVIDGHIVDKDKVLDIADKIIHGHRVDPKTGVILTNGHNSYVTPGVTLVIKDNIMHNTIERNIAAWNANGYVPEADLIDAYVLAALKELDEVPVGRFPKFLYSLADKNQLGGFYNGKMISVNVGDGYYAGDEAHEARHLIDRTVHQMYAPGGKAKFGRWFFDRFTPSALAKFIGVANNLDKIIRAAYDDDFLNLSNLTDDLYKALGDEGYKILRRVNMAHEAVTTNRDARSLLLSRLDSLSKYLPKSFKRMFGEELPEGITDIKKAPIWLQNALIDKTPDWLIFEVLEDGDNLYGTAYIRFLRNNHKLTSKKAALFRNAMKYVGVYGVPLTAGTTLFNDE